MAFVRMTSRYGNEATVHESRVEHYSAMGYSVVEPEPDVAPEAPAPEPAKAAPARRKS